MKHLVLPASLLLAPLLLAACAGYEPPPAHSLDVTCDTGGRHGPTGVMDWTCIDGDGEQRLRTRSLHEVIEGAPIEDSSASDEG